MLKILKEKWAKNSDKLFEKISQVVSDDCCTWDYTYSDLVKLTFDTVFNDNSDMYSYDYRLDVDHITKVDNGDYQGTLLFLIPFDTYQPGEGEYLMTYVGYGSCSGCDALQHALCLDGDNMHKAIFNIAKDLITNAIKPYNHGWRHVVGFEQVTFEEEDNE